MSRRRGFTLVELMTVVTIIGVMAVIAIVSIRKDRSQNDADAWANQIRNTMIQARRRAVATGNPYMIEITGNTAPTTADKIQWCQVDLNDCKATQTMSCANPCNGKTTPCEVGQPIRSGIDAITDSWTAAADMLTYQNTYVGPTKTSLGNNTVQIFFGPKGIVDASTNTPCLNALNSATGSGFTAYVRANNKVATANSATEKHRRVVVLGSTGRPRIIDNW